MAEIRKKKKVSEKALTNHINFFVLVFLKISIIKSDYSYIHI